MQRGRRYRFANWCWRDSVLVVTGAMLVCAVVAASGLRGVMQMDWVSLGMAGMGMVVAVLLLTPLWHRWRRSITVTETELRLARCRIDLRDIREARAVEGEVRLTLHSGEDLDLTRPSDMVPAVIVAAEIMACADLAREDGADEACGDK